MHPFLPTVKEGNVFRSISHSVLAGECLPTRGSLPSSGSHCSGRYTSYWNAFLLPPANRVCEKVIFLQVCVILSRGGVYPIMQWASTPPRQTPPRLCTPRDYVPPELRTPPPPVDGLCAVGTHPTGMHSCCDWNCDFYLPHGKESQSCNRSQV